jgi:hypothetical protein
LNQTRLRNSAAAARLSAQRIKSGLRFDVVCTLFISIVYFSVTNFVFHIDGCVSIRVKDDVLK